jgi:hypothetical protein
MPTKKAPEEVLIQRDQELENILGNLLIAQYQVDKLSGRLAEKIKGYGGRGSNGASTFMIKVGNEYLKIDVSVKGSEITPGI